MTEETIIHEETNIKITTHRAIINETTYPITNITSVSTQEQAPSGCAPAAGVMFGLLLIVIGIANIKESAGLIVGGLLIALPSLYVAILRDSQRPAILKELGPCVGNLQALLLIQIFSVENRHQIVVIGIEPIFSLI